MKIRISDDEVYEIKMPEEIGITEFQGIVAKFNFLMKNFSRFDIGDSQSSQSKGEIVLKGKPVREYKKHDRERWNFLRDNRDILKEILIAHYHKTKEEFYEVVAKHNLNFTKNDICSAKFLALREMHKVKPKEVGLKKFPNKFEQVSNLRLEGWGE